MGNVTKVDTVWFSVKDMDKAVEFYSGVLGLQIGHKSPYWTSLMLGEIQIGLHGPNDPQLSRPVNGWTVSLLTDSVKQLREALVAAGVELEPGYHDTPRGVVVTFNDPDGNRLQAMQLGVKASEIDP